MRICLTNNVARILHLTILFLILFISGTILNSKVNADWTNVGKVNGVQVYRDNDTGLEWTVSLSRVSSFGAAKQKVTNLGFRLPTHREYRSLERNGGITRLNINATWGSGFYWEATGNMVNGNGGNFKSLLPPNYAHIGNPYVIGVRRQGQIFGMVFGVRCSNRHDNNGVTVTYVFPDYPGARAGLEKGDVILEIDGQRIWDIQDYSNTVDAAGKTMNLKVRNVRNGQISNISVSLR
jgi:hypothetical protein